MSISFVQDNWMLVAVLLISGTMLVFPAIQRRFSPTQEVGTLRATQLINRENAVLLDVREPKEYEGGRLPNAVHIPLSQLASRGQELGKLTARPIIVYCDRGARGQMAGKTLEKLGFAAIYFLDGGIRAWKEAGLPVDKA